MTALAFSLTKFVLNMCSNIFCILEQLHHVFHSKWSERHFIIQGESHGRKSKEKISQTYLVSLCHTRKRSKPFSDRSNYKNP